PGGLLGLRLLAFGRFVRSGFRLRCSFLGGSRFSRLFSRFTLGLRHGFLSLWRSILGLWRCLICRGRSLGLWGGFVRRSFALRLRRLLGRLVGRFSILICRLI